MKRLQLRARRRETFIDGLDRVSNRQGKELMSEIRSLMEGGTTTQIYGSRALMFDKEDSWDVNPDFDIRTDKWDVANEFRGRYSRMEKARGEPGIEGGKEAAE